MQGTRYADMCNCECSQAFIRIVNWANYRTGLSKRLDVLKTLRDPMKCKTIICKTKNNILSGILTITTAST